MCAFYGESFCWISVIFPSCDYVFICLSGCGGSIEVPVDKSGSFAHPGYPAAYRTYMNCRYLFRTVPGKRIRLDFDLFDMEESGGCVYDYLQVIDGNSKDDRVVGKFCGNHKPASIISSGNFLSVVFITDATTVRRGFKANYRTYESQSQTTRKPAESELESLIFAFFNFGRDSCHLDFCISWLVIFRHLELANPRTNS